MGAAASAQVSVPIHNRKCLYIADERSELEAAAMNVGAKRAAERQPIRPGLLLNYTPLPTLVLLHGDKAFDKRGPLNPGIGFDYASCRIEAKLVLHRARVDHYRSARELLAAHGMTATRNRNRLSVTPGSSNCSP